MAAYKKADYFEMFERGAGFALAAANMLKEMINGGAASEERLAAFIRVKRDEDDHMNMIRGHLEEAFITPIDRDDIYKIAKETDDITCSVYSAANKLWMMNVSRPDAQMKTMADCIVNACEKVAGLISEMKNYKKKNSIGEKAAEINEIKEAGDRCCMDAVRYLFMNEEDPVELIKMKETYEGLKEILNSCSGAADCVQAILITKT